MATIKTTLESRKIDKGIKQILVTPFNEGGTAPGEIAYQLDDIIADTTSILQDDPETTDIECETRDEPVDTVTTLGSYQFTTTSGDVQKELLTNIMGFKEDTTSKILYAPSAYKDIYAEVRIVFSNGEAFVLPKVKLNNKISAENMKTGIVQATISGTAFSKGVTINSSPDYSSFYIVPAEGTDPDAPTEE